MTSNYINLFELKLPTANDSLVENRRFFDYNDFQVNVFETYTASTHVKLVYDGLSISSMIRGKKYIHKDKKVGFEFLPGTSMLIPKGMELYADFPEADEHNPVQCATLLIKNETIQKNIDFLNHYYPNKKEPWAFDFDNYHFNNSSELTNCINNLLEICAKEDSSQKALPDLLLKTLLVRIIEAQREHTLETSDIKFSDTFFTVKHYIKQNLHKKITTKDLCKVANCSKSTLYRLFDEYCNASPMQYVMLQRLKKSKAMLLDPIIMCLRLLTYVVITQLAILLSVLKMKWAIHLKNLHKSLGS